MRKSRERSCDRSKNKGRPRVHPVSRKLRAAPANLVSPRTNPRLRAGLYGGDRLLATPKSDFPAGLPGLPEPTTRRGSAHIKRARLTSASRALLSDRWKAAPDYLVIFATTPEPTVRPPSRIAKRRPSSMAIGAISLTPIVTLSPGITISVPSGRMTSPVTSVVRK